VLAERFGSHVTRAAFAKAEEQGWKAVAIDCGHDVMIDDPQGLATLLLEELSRR
jgi:hypothetical protein